MSSYEHFRPTPRFRFTCPLCGSTAYEHVLIRRTGGSILQTTSFQCSGCTVLFRDPERFTRLERMEGDEYLAGPPRPKSRR